MSGHQGMFDKPLHAYADCTCSRRSTWGAASVAVVGQGVIICALPCCSRWRQHSRHGDDIERRAGGPHLQPHQDWAQPDLPLHRPVIIQLPRCRPCLQLQLHGMGGSLNWCDLPCLSPFMAPAAPLSKCQSTMPPGTLHPPACWTLPCNFHLPIVFAPMVSDRIVRISCGVDMLAC
jgi:hypothetical protein